MKKRNDRLTKTKVENSTLAENEAFLHSTTKTLAGEKVKNAGSDRRIPKVLQGDQNMVLVSSALSDTNLSTRTRSMNGATKRSGSKSFSLFRLLKDNVPQNKMAASKSTISHSLRKQRLKHLKKNNTKIVNATISRLITPLKQNSELIRITNANDTREKKIPRTRVDSFHDPVNLDNESMEVMVQSQPVQNYTMKVRTKPRLTHDLV